MIKNMALIGAGAISKSHLTAYKSIRDVSVTAICDLNGDLAKARAAEFNIPKYCNDYYEILADPTIDAVTIVTPTFTHAEIVADALKSGKHVLCEKPPALTWQEAQANEALAAETGKVLMYGFVCRFDKNNMFLKDYIDAGRIGEVYYAEAARMQRCAKIGGWFRDKSKSGGGNLIDAAIHQLDLLLYFMGYPEVKSVKGFTSDVNKDLPERIKGTKGGWAAATNSQIERTIESFASGHITLEGGKCISIKAAHITNTLNPGTRFELMGDKGGAAFADGAIRLLSIDESDYFMESQPVIKDGGPDFAMEIRHFIDCCNGVAECICKPREGTQLIKIINAIYESAETGKEIVF